MGIDVDEKQPFMTHLEELRQRLIACIIAVGICFVASYFFADKIFELLVSPLKDVLPKGDHLIFTNLPEMFIAYIKVSLVSAILIAAPVIFYEMWMFVAPGLRKNERQYVLPFVLSSTVLFVGGALFGYFIVFPFGFKFFISFSNDYVKAMPSVKEYFSFSIKLLFAFGVVFELPVIIFFLTKLGIITTDFLKKQRKYAALITFIVAAILTPPDVATQCMMAVPLLILYEVGILVSRFAGKKKEDTNRTV